MTRRRKDPFAGKENVRHFRLVQRPLGASESPDNINNSNPPTFDEMFEEYDPSGMRREVEYEEYEELEDSDNLANYDFANDDDGELVDIDAELDQFAEDFIDIEGDDRVDRVKMALAEDKVGEAAKYGILLDDRDYDYTKHLRRVGVTPGAVFIQAPGTKKEKEPSDKKQTRDFFTEETETVQLESESDDIPASVAAAVPEDVLKANHEAARQQYRALLQQVGDDPMLREVIEALEDDRYVTEDIDDELVISLDNMNIRDDNDDFFDEDVDILDEDEKFPDFIPSEALKRQMEKIAAQEAELEELDELDEIMNEYATEDEEEEDIAYNSRPYFRSKEFIDIEGESDGSLANDHPVKDEEAEEIYKYLKEHGRARGTTLYDKKRPDHLPPIHIAIAQYNELRKELAVNNDLIIRKYAEEDEDEVRRQIQESEKIIAGMVKLIDDPAEMEKRLNIETAKYLTKLSEGSVSGPKKIIESGVKTREVRDPEPSDSESTDSDSSQSSPKINKGAARSVNETAEEKRARKAKIKAEKREKRVEKKNRK